ncbi:hypothetical protein BDY24DRAFT_406288 [Mrakia frigida]|uniref:uncharacterized protein n=1 Tax=Mrakia frigida TaxID=29902 RepID=UPI003FCC1CF3
MPSSDPNALNASGLTPAQSKALPTRQPTGEESKILEHIKELYRCAPTNDSFSIYSQTAIFHDPIGYADGLGPVRAQFEGLPKLFKGGATIDKFEVLESGNGGNLRTILINQDVTYYLKERPSDPTKTVNSLLTLERDGSGLITKHSEEWDHKRETTSEDGFFGTLNEWRKKATAAATGVFVGKEEKDHSK